MDHVRTLLIVTPFSTPSGAYPGAAYLARYLRRRQREVHQADLSLEAQLLLFSRGGLERVFATVEPLYPHLSTWNKRLFGMRDRYLSTIDSVVRFLQGKDNTIAYRIIHRDFLPRGENFENVKGFDWYDNSTLPLHDRAKFVATQYLYDIANLVREGVFPYFQMTLLDRFYDDFVHWCATFDRMRDEVQRPPNLLDEFVYRALDEHLETERPHVVGVSVPFARNLYWALRIGRRVKEWNPNTVVVAGGGLFNTSMRHPNEPRLFDYIDYLTLDDGERPLLDIVEHLEGVRDIEQLKRTFYRDPNGAIAYSNGCTDDDAAHEESGAPDYTGYRVSEYFSTLETTNINQRIKTDGFWNRLTMAHGCYWKKCSFCDIHLSYIGDYDPASAKNLVDKVEEILAQTGQTGFHFVDEALPPKVMRDFALEVLRRGLNISWHSMLRFDKSFTLEFCRLLAAAGMVGAFGGLEVASNRLLQLMKKGTTVEQVAQVARNFQEAGIRVHAYIMYGFPTQTAQETVDALDVVRQLFWYGALTSASWAKFGVTPHSPIGRNPEEYKITVRPVPDKAFIEQILVHDDPVNDHGKFSVGLEAAVKFFGMGMHGDKPSEGWFDFEVPPVSIDRDLIGKALAERTRLLAAPPTAADLRRDKRMVWLGSPPSVNPVAGKPDVAELVLHGATDETVSMDRAQAVWLAQLLDRARMTHGGPIQLGEVAASCPTSFDELAKSPAWQKLRDFGLVTMGGSDGNAAPATATAPGGGTVITLRKRPEAAPEPEPKPVVLVEPVTATNS